MEVGVGLPLEHVEGSPELLGAGVGVRLAHGVHGRPEPPRAGGPSLPLRTRGEEEHGGHGQGSR
jgi:hypothetical protein